MDNSLFWAIVFGTTGWAAAVYGWGWGLTQWFDARDLRRENLRLRQPIIVPRIHAIEAGTDKLMADVMVIPCKAKSCAAAPPEVATDQQDGAI